MLLFNLLILFLIVILSFLFKLGETNKYDTQLLFILLCFTVLVMYKTLNNIYNNMEKKRLLKNKIDTFITDENKLNDFVNDTLTNTEKIRILESELDKYRKAYGTESILNNNLDVKISDLQKAIKRLSSEYNTDLENNNPGGNAPVKLKIESSEHQDIDIDYEGIKTNINEEAITKMVSDLILSLKDKEFTVNV